MPVLLPPCPVLWAAPVLALWRRQRAAACLLHWSISVTANLTDRLSLLHASRHASATIRAGALARWVGLALGKAQRRESLAVAAARAWRGVRAKTVQIWREMVAVKLARRRAAVAVVRRWVERRSREAFWRWRKEANARLDVLSRLAETLREMSAGARGGAF